MSGNTLQEFVESTAGQIIAISIIVALFAAILISGKSKRADVKSLVMSAIFVALYLALNQIIIFRMPQGGSITAFSMLAITLCGYLLGIRRGIMAGMCAGLVELIFNPYVIHPLQLLLDYPLAVGALGFSGLLRNKNHGLISGYFLGSFCRFICTLLSGVIFFGEYAPEGFSPFTWSLYYNIVYIGSEAVITGLILMLPSLRKNLERLRIELDQ